MGFNYAREKREFIKKWKLLRAGYEEAGMSEEAIKKLYSYDWEWFCSRRSFANHSQELPVEQLDENDDCQSSLINKFSSMRTEFDECTFNGRLAWVDTVEDKVLTDKLKRLSPKDLELLTLLVMDGFSQTEVALLLGCSQNAISKRFIKIKNYLK